MINVINVHLCVIRNASNGGEDETLSELSVSEYDSHTFSEFKVSVKDVSDHITPQISIYCSTWQFFSFFLSFPFPGLPPIFTSCLGCLLAAVSVHFALYISCVYQIISGLFHHFVSKKFCHFLIFINLLSVSIYDVTVA